MQWRSSTIMKLGGLKCLIQNCNQVPIIVNCTLKNSNQSIINHSTKGTWLVKSVRSKNAGTTSTCKQEGRSCKYVYKYISWWRMHFMATVNYLWWFKNKVNKNWEKEEEVDKHSLMSIRFFFDFFLKKLLFYIVLKHWS